MSKTTAPFLSLAASGKFANTLVASTWKGIPYMRKYVIPANPKTDAQVAHRALWTAIVAAYKTYLTDATLRASWRRLAGLLSATMSGFNAAIRNMMTMIKTDPDASFVVSAAESAGIYTFTLENIDDGATGDETGDFEVWRGLTASNLSLIESVAIAAGDVPHTHGLDVSTVYYIKLRKDSADRSGIFQVTATAA